MYNCATYNCSDSLLEHEVITGCPTSGRLGGLSDLLLFACNNEIDSDEPDATAINAEIDAGRAVWVYSVKAGMNAPAPVETDSTTSCGTAAISTYDRSLTIEDYNISAQNCAAWNPLLSGQSVGAMLLIECDTEGLPAQATFINKEIKFSGGREIPNVNTALQKFNITAKWRSLTDPCPYAAPTGLHDLDA